MSKRIQAKHKLDRRVGENIWGRPRSPVNKRDYGPGMHGQKRRARRSDYAIQLRAKQKYKGYYGCITEKQFRRAYEEAVRLRGDTVENLVGLLERRLDSFVYRSKFVPTIFAARQLVNHGHVCVNGRVVDIPSALLQAGDRVSLREKACTMALVLEAVSSQEREVPEYISADHKTMCATLSRIPVIVDVPYPVIMEPHLVIEFYSRT